MNLLKKNQALLDQVLPYIEPIVFAIVLGYHLVPLMQFHFFPTLDGAAHLHNANLIKTLFTENNTFIEQYIAFNNELVPNWTGHFILAIFSYFLPALTAEKILIILYVIGLSYAFRRLLKIIAPRGMLFSYFVFPLSFNALLFLGFYNFSIALIFMLLTLSFWIKNYHNISQLKNLIYLSILFFLSYLSHIFIFGLLGIFIGLHIISFFITDIWEYKKPFKNTLITTLHKLKWLLISSAAPFALMISYYLKRQDFGKSIHLYKRELLTNLQEGWPLISLNQGEEVQYTSTIVQILLAFIVMAALWRLYLFFFQKKQFINFSDFWIFSAFIIGVMYIILPNHNDGGGFISMRLALLLMFFIIIWLASQKFSYLIKIPLIIIVLNCNFKLNSYYEDAFTHLNTITKSIEETATYIEPNSTVLPFDYINYAIWISPHFSNYLGIDKPIILLENYETGKGYFPLVWNYETFYNNTLGNNTQEYEISCVYWPSTYENKKRPIDYIFRLGTNYTPDECYHKIEGILQEQYTLVHQNEHCSLYKYMF